MNLPQRVKINDVMLRDGLQLEEKILTVEQKEKLFEGLVEANVDVVEFGSFVHPNAVPQMANTGELFTKIKDTKDVKLLTLVPNFIGVKNAAKAGVETVNFVFSASNTHNLQNVRQTTEQSLQVLEEISDFCKEENITLNASIATTFGCPFEGVTDADRVVKIVDKLHSLNINYISMADTTGVANPKQVYDLMVRLTDLFPEITFNMHFHNTRGMGLANVLASLEAGITNYDSALGGLGGCPFAPDATGNISTEDVVHMLHEMGIDTGIDLDKLLETTALLQQYVGHELSSSVFKAGKSSRRFSVEDM